MTPDEISRLAATGKKPPEGMNCADRCLYYALRDMYQAYKSGDIDADEGARQKAVALRQHKIDRNEVDRAERYTRHVAEMWKRIEWAAKCYHDLHNLDSADRFVEAVYGCKLKEGSDNDEQRVI